MVMFLEDMATDLVRISALASKEARKAGHPEEFTAIIGTAYCVGALKGMQIHLKLSHNERMAELGDIEGFLKECMKNLKEINGENK